jgi:hypothetical protein
MKPIKSLLVLAIVCAPLVASAQGYYGRGGNGGAPVPGGFHNRTGRLSYGFGLGVGGMYDGGSAITSCANCDVQPLAGEADFHIGGVLSPRLALLFELQGNIQTVHSDAFNGDTLLKQGAAMFAAQFWVLPQLWLKGGIGFANLQVDDAYFLEDFGTGVAFLGAAGVELFSARNFALDLQGRVLQTSYNSLDDNVTSATIGIGIDWY